MNRTSFFRGLAYGLLLSLFLWSGIIYGVSNLLNSEDVAQDQMVEKEDSEDYSVLLTIKE